MSNPLKTWLMVGSLALSGAIAPPVAVSDEYGLPRLGASGSSVSSNEEYRLGRAWLRQFRAHAPAWQDPIAQDYVESLVSRLLPHSGLDDVHHIVTLVDSRMLNAFAVPGGVIGVNSGLFAFAEDEASLVSVLAHELGHLSQSHFARGMQRAEQTQIPAMAAMLAGMLIAAGGGGDAGIATAMGSQAAFIQDQLAYSRRFEQEADRIGLQTMAQAGYDPQAMVRMFRAMQRMAALQGGNPPEFLLTHPVTESRITDTESRASQMNASRVREQEPHYELVRARALLDLNRTNPDQAIARLAEGNPPASASRYLEALVAAERGDTQTALQELDVLAEELPDLPLIPASAAEVAFEAGDYDATIERTRRLLRIFPNYLPAQRLRAEALLHRDPGQAFQALRSLTDRRDDDPQLFALLAEASGRSGNEAWGHLARAEHLQLTGRIDRAIRQLAVAKEVAENSGESNLSSRIEQRRKDFLTYRDTMEKFR